MLTPVRCFTCNALVPAARYRELLLHTTSKEAFATLGIRRYCCSRMLLCDPPELTELLSGLRLRDVATEESELYVEMLEQRDVGCQ